ncbi:MAG TPA: hypothetical protein VGR21_01415, partial [Cryptosporangiaceae bacterium]|nr:hypothetical protein [Cryptosporangiaceae bacterium]
MPDPSAMPDEGAVAGRIAVPGARGSLVGRLPVALLFGLFGVVAGTWAGRIPWVQDARDLSAGELGLA